MKSLNYANVSLEAELQDLQLTKIYLGKVGFMDSWISSNVRPLVSGTILKINTSPSAHIAEKIKNVPEK